MHDLGFGHIRRGALLHRLTLDVGHKLAQVLQKRLDLFDVRHRRQRQQIAIEIELVHVVDKQAEVFLRGLSTIDNAYNATGSIRSCRRSTTPATA